VQTGAQTAPQTHPGPLGPELNDDAPFAQQEHLDLALRAPRPKCGLDTKPCVFTLRRKQHALTADLANTPLGGKLRFLLPFFFRKSCFLPRLRSGRFRRNLSRRWHLRAAK
jgi:hypothetical protein